MNLKELSLRESYPYYLAGEAQTPNTDLEVVDKYSGEVATRVPLADPAAIDAAIAAATEAAEPLRALAPYERQDVLNHCVARFRERFDEFAHSLCVEDDFALITQLLCVYTIRTLLN